MARAEPSWEDGLPIWDGVGLNNGVIEYHNQLRKDHACPPLEFDEQARKWAHLAVADSAKQDHLVSHHVGKDCGQSLFEYNPFKKGDEESFAISIAAHGIDVWY